MESNDVIINLYHSSFSTAQNVFYGRTLLGNTITNTEIAEEMVASGISDDLDLTVRQLNYADRLKARYVAEGHPVHTPYCYAYLGVSGTWEASETHKYISKKHSFHTCFSEGAESKSLNSSLKGNVLGVADCSSNIGSVFDSRSESQDYCITPLGGVSVKGYKIKITGTLPGVGIFLKNLDGTSTVEVDPKDILLNTPAELKFIVPEMPVGEYYLYVCTQFSNSSTNTKEVKEVVFNIPLSVMAEEEVNA